MSSSSPNDSNTTPFYNDDDNEEVITKKLLEQYKPYHLEYKYQIGLGKIYDPIIIEAEKDKEYFAKEYQLLFTGVGNRVFSRELVARCKSLGETYDPENVDYFSEKFLCCDPAFYGSHFGIVINEVSMDGNVHVLYAEEFHRKDTQAIIDKILDLRIKYRNIKNILIDASQSEFIMDIKMYFDNQGYEYPDSYNEKIREWQRVMGKEPWEQLMYVIPVPFNKRIEYTQRLKKIMENGNYHIHPSFDKLILAFDTAVSKNLDVNDIDKEHTEYSDLLDAQLCLMRRIKPI